MPCSSGLDERAYWLPIGPIRSCRPLEVRTLHRIVISDLHLRPDAESDDRATAFAAFLDDLVRDEDVHELVLLGDTFDLPEYVVGTASRAAAVERWAVAGRDVLVRIVERHPRLSESLRRFAAGRTLRVVPGNHDLALAQPAVRAALHLAVGPVDLQPWILYVPGVLYAEHGQQYHEINAARSLLEPDPRWAAPGAPLAWPISALTEPGGPGRAAAIRELATGPARAVVHGPALARARASYRDRIVAATSGVDLPLEALRAIDRLATTSPLHVAARIVASALRRGGALDGFSLRLLAVARSIDSILGTHGRSVPLYLFGHAHRPTIARLRPGGPALYANAGSWTSLRPAVLSRLIRAARYPFLRIVEGPAGEAAPEVALGLWNMRTLSREPYPATDVAAAMR